MYRPSHCRRFKSRTRNAVAKRRLRSIIRVYTLRITYLNRSVRGQSRAIPIVPSQCRDHGSRDSNRVRPVDPGAIRHRDSACPTRTGTFDNRDAGRRLFEQRRQPTRAAASSWTAWTRSRFR